MTQPANRPHNREVEDEMIRPPPARNDPPRPATEPVDGNKPYPDGK